MKVYPINNKRDALKMVREALLNKQFQAPDLYTYNIEVFDVRILKDGIRYIRVSPKSLTVCTTDADEDQMIRLTTDEYKELQQLYFPRKVETTIKRKIDWFYVGVLTAAFALCSAIYYFYVCI